MEKFKKEIIGGEENKIVDFIWSLIDGGLGGDWSDNYKEGDIIKYDFEIDEDYILDLKDDGLDINEIKEFISDGICLIDKIGSEYFNKDICYNVEYENGVVIVNYEYFDLEG
jgi:hypothetical protein